LISELIELQLPTVGRRDDLLAGGVPDARSRALAIEIEDVVRRRAPDDPNLADLLGDIDRRLGAIDACGLPDVLVHGDAHPGNARIGVEPGVWFDWGDSRIGNPLLDLAVLERLSARGLSDEDVSDMRDHWLAAWGAAAPGSDPVMAWKLFEPLAQLRLAGVYQRFLDNIEDSERHYHEGDVMPILEAVSAHVAR
jgi:aminoglycoside phosphotransferase (APT) family kinase protein